ncbi:MULTISPECIES: putative bifunctional diguanylate cyclase/phosphodiesterase [Catenuloplanes]|uniref:Diguanylate cyclase (GGDEF)-like protein n=1 Tax=Catenuloplanes niger TaxID=587534 RepID=A0AAE3ZHK8_9ACTN|nr:bifunctional diguanylate cyclase/phosphodiesterase [Catenuloplanes niger]MDR7320107.1 diguanylate cyclase (GGDEF)-like protein [Catenuloplanes niger]
MRRAVAVPILLVVVVAVGQIASFADPDLRVPIFGASLLLLDALGIGYSLRAARYGAPLTWRITAAGRALSLSMSVCFAVDSVQPSLAWWWAGALSGLTMFATLTAAALSASVRRLRGRERIAFAAELLTVFSCAFILVWQLVLAPAFLTPAGYRWVFEIGFGLGNLLLSVVIGTLLLRGAGRGLGEPITLLLWGMMSWAVADIVFSSIRINGGDPSESPGAVLALTSASLLMTVAAMRTDSAARADAGVTWSTPPIWSLHLPYIGVALGSVVLVAITIEDQAFATWGGLILAQSAMTIAVMLRQLVSLRNSRDAGSTDPLTGLANLAGLRAGLRRATGRFGILLIDLDDFKPVNDRYGHETGNLLLTHVADTLRGTVRSTDIAARVGGDEFVIVLFDLDGSSALAEASAVAERVLAAFAATPIEVGEHRIFAHASIGVAVSTGDEDPKAVQHRADLAMYEAKRNDKHGWRAYDPSMTDQRTRESILADLLEHAVEAGQLGVHYQPIVDLATGRTVGVEALARWQHPDFGFLPPSEFVPIAERSNLIHAIGMHVLAEAAGQVRAWQARQHTDPLQLSVNLSPRQLLKHDIVTDVVAVLERTGLSPAHLTLEITETAIVDTERAAPILARFRALGVRIAIDDFGTGYSSLQYLLGLPIDGLKIDRAFVTQLDSTTRGAAVAEAVVRLGQILGLDTVAEGIESPAQVAELQLLGCTSGQGYLFSPPRPAAEIEDSLNLIPPQTVG